MSTPFDSLASTLEQFTSAWKANDGGALAAFFVEEGTLINPFGQRADGRAAVAAMYREYFNGILRARQRVAFSGPCAWSRVAMP